jgi:hypothetical protein
MQLIVKGMVPNLLHILPVPDNAALNGVPHGDNPALRLCLVAVVAVSLLRFYEFDSAAAIPGRTQRKSRSCPFRPGAGICLQSRERLPEAHHRQRLQRNIERKFTTESQKKITAGLAHARTIVKNLQPVYKTQSTYNFESITKAASWSFMGVHGSGLHQTLWFDWQ